MLDSPSFRGYVPCLAEQSNDLSGHSRLQQMSSNLNEFLLQRCPMFLPHTILTHLPKIWTTWKVRIGQFQNSPSRRIQEMKKNFTNEQITATLKLVESGTSVADACRKLGITEQTFYRWKPKFGGMGIAELQRMRQLENENKRLKALVADLTLDKHMLQEVIAKKL
jgi:putative transposase